MIDTFEDVTITRGCRLECPCCHEPTMAHSHLKGYGRVIEIVFKCNSCGRKSALEMARTDRGTMVGWRSVGVHGEH
jgi:C4-type Zn-finger protein